MLTFTLIFFYFLYNLLLCIQPTPQINYKYNMKMTKKETKYQNICIPQGTLTNLIQKHRNVTKLESGVS